LKRVVSFFLLFVLVTTFNPLLSEAKTIEAPTVGSRAAILIDLNTGKALYKKNINEKLAPASTTKILTAIVVLEKCDLNKVVTVSKRAASQEPSKIYLKQGEKITVKNLLYAMLMESANDAAYALAETVGGSIDGFSKLMNEKARSIGCKSSNFVNPNGLYEKNHYTTASDLGLISQYAMKKPLFRQIVATKTYTLPATNKSKARKLQNHNKMLLNTSYYYPGCTGVKTGYTYSSKHTLVASATRGKKKLLVVLLKNNNVPYNDAARLFNYGFSAKK
jgi:D-alanyl-D-alanine carboxypeptidase (penicillin-binding protein 5/6)